MFGMFKKETDAKATPQRFFSVAISDKLVQTALWETEDNIKVLAKSETKPYFNDNDLLIKLDTCLQDLGAEGEMVHQTLFHLDSSFIQGQNLLPAREKLFKNVTKQLQLESLGFVTNIEAVITAKLELNPSLKKQLVVEFLGDKTIFSLYDQKNLVDSFAGNPAESFVEQFKAALVQLAGQLGVDYSSYFEQKSELAPSQEIDQPLFVNFISALLPTAQISEQVETLPAKLPMRTEILGSEILLSFILIPSATVIAESYGWIHEVNDAPINKIKVDHEDDLDEPPITAATLATTSALSRQTKFEPPVIEKNPQLSDRHLHQFSSQTNNRTIIIGAIVAGFILTLALGYWLLISQTSVRLILTPKTALVSKNLNVIIDPSVKTSDYDKLILPGKIEDYDITHEMSLTATGQKNIGEKAKGKVELINKMTESKVLQAGTQLYYDEIFYTTDNEVTVPAATKESNNDGEKINYGKTEVTITAADAGSKANLIEGSMLRIANYNKDDFEARVLSGGIAGGTDKMVTVFSAADQKAALQVAQRELAAAATQQIGSKDGNNYLAPQTSAISISKQVFDVEVGQEATDVVLTISASMPVIVYQLDELAPLAEQTLSKEVPAGYQLVANELSLLSTVDESKTNKAEDKIYLTVDMSQPIEAIIDQEAVKKEILGQKLTKVNNWLSGQESIAKYQLIWSNNFYPKVNQSIPKNSGKVSVEIKVD